jgi:hypothetical protein
MSETDQREFHGEDIESAFEPLTPESIISFPSVVKWLDSVNSGKDISVMSEQLNLVAEFCNFVRQTPDEMIAKCIRNLKDGTRAISTKGRNITEENIKNFVKARAKTGNEAIVEENKIRGFFVHNGIFMQGRAAIL